MNSSRVGFSRVGGAWFCDKCHASAALSDSMLVCEVCGLRSGRLSVGVRAGVVSGELRHVRAVLPVKLKRSHDLGGRCEYCGRRLVAGFCPSCQGGYHRKR